MKIKHQCRIRIELTEDDMNLVIHALQSHAEYGDNKWPGEGQQAAEIRDVIMNADRKHRGEYY